MKFLQSLLVCFLLSSVTMSAQQIAQWRGPDRNGVFPGKGLLKIWPENGPRLLWSKDGLGEGYSSVSVTQKSIFVTGRQDSTEYLTVLDLKGRERWRLPYGLGVRRSYSSSRCTPTVEGNFVYLISGRGEVVCIDVRKKQKVWSVPALQKFRGEYWKWEIAESPLLVGDKVIYTPGGPLTTMVAFDKKTGETIWQSVTLNDTSAFVSPILVEFGGRKIIVNVTINYIFGVDAADGSILWQVKYSEIEPPENRPWAPKINCVTPLYHNGQIFVTSGYDHVGVMFKLIDGGKAIRKIWTNATLDCHHGQVVRVGNYIYGANWINNSKGNWCCLDWKTGKTMYEKAWYGKGSISAADGMLYCYEEKRGNLALVEPTPAEFKIISAFTIELGKGRHWTQPVIAAGVLYIRHGNVLMAYDIKA